jgi:hypothetical protein
VLSNTAFFFFFHQSFACILFGFTFSKDLLDVFVLTNGLSTYCLEVLRMLKFEHPKCVSTKKSTYMSFCSGIECCIGLK